MDRVRRQVVEAFDESTGPAYLDRIYSGRQAQAEVDTDIAAGVVAGTTADLVHESARARFDRDASANAVAVRFRSHRANSNPVIGVADLIHQETGRRIKIRDYHRDAAVVPK